MGQHFTVGDLLNLGVLVLLWITYIYNMNRHKKEDYWDDREVLDKHLLECAARNGGVDQQLKSFGARLDKLDDTVERRMDAVDRRLTTMNRMFGNIAHVITAQAPEDEG